MWFIIFCWWSDKCQTISQFDRTLLTIGVEFISFHCSLLWFMVTAPLALQLNKLLCLCKLCQKYVCKVPSLARTVISWQGYCCIAYMQCHVCNVQTNIPQLLTTGGLASLLWFCWLGGATWISRKLETIVACYILVVKWVLLSHRSFFFFTLDSQKQ